MPEDQKLKLLAKLVGGFVWNGAVYAAAGRMTDSCVGCAFYSDRQGCDKAKDFNGDCPSPGPVWAKVNDARRKA